MLARDFKLNKRSEIEKVKREGKLFQGDDFGVSIINRRDGKPSRYAFIISTKITKVAVHRNRMRRAMIESVRHNFHLMPKNYDVLFLAKTSMTRKTTDEIMRQVKEFMTRQDIKK
jgi:ribonuclease P protein component